MPIGIAQAIRRNRMLDHGLTGVSFLLYSMPTFWLALLLIDILSARLRIFPPEAPQGTTLGQVLTDPVALILPVLTLVLINFALFSRYMRASAIESLAQDYIKVARSKGLPEHKILVSHVLRNSMLPIVTLLGLSLPWLFTAGLVIEQIFNYPGNGSAVLHLGPEPGLSRGTRHHCRRRGDNGRRQPAGRHRLRRARPAHPVQLGARR